MFPWGAHSLISPSTRRSTAHSSRVKRFSGRDVSVDLEKDVKFDQFFPGRLSAYFEPTDIQRNKDSILNVASSMDSAYVEMGFVVGRMNRSFVYVTLLSALLNRFGPNGYFTQSLQCLRTAYINEQGRLRQASRELNLSDRFDIPSVDIAIENGRRAQLTTEHGRDTGADNSAFEQYFDQRVTARIREALRNTR
jgi:hypothetical protein